jgi:thioredoxin-related protein
MKSLISFLLLFICSFAMGQNKESKELDPPYLRFPNLPAFELLNTDSVAFGKSVLKPNKPTMVMFVSVTCDHCQHQMDSLISRIEEFKKIQIVIGVYQPMDELRAFIEKYNLKEHKNIFVGRDHKFLMVPFFGIHNLPCMTLYNAKGELITKFEGTTPINKLLEKLKS